MLPVAILAGGFATRLHPITETIPKSLVPVAGKPFIERQLNQLRDQGFSQAVLCVGHLGGLIRDAVGNGKDFGITISYSEDGPSLLGTAGALKKAVKLLGEEFFVLYGDSYLPIEFCSVQEAYHKSNEPALMTVIRNDNKWDKSNVLYVNDKIVEYNKRKSRPDMAHIDYGLAVVKATVFDQIPEDKASDLADVYHALSLEGQLAGFEVHERLFEMGSLGGLKETDQYFLKKERK